MCSPLAAQAVPVDDAVNGTIIGAIRVWSGDMRGPQEGAEIAIETIQKAKVYSRVYHRHSESGKGRDQQLFLLLSLNLIISIASWGRNVNAKPFWTQQQLQ